MAAGIYDSSPEDELPHPPISLAILLVVEQALRKAWELLLANPPTGFGPATATEDEITYQLWRILNDHVLKRKLVSGFDREVLGNVFFREPKVDSFNQSSIDKMPDLLIPFAYNARPSAMVPRQDAIFIECKPVDRDHPAGKDYCDKGIVRFVRGEYAWAMTSAVMVGYARGDYKIVPKLTDALSARLELQTTGGLPRVCEKSPICEQSDAVHLTTHNRKFVYQETGKGAPVIVLRHLWLNRPEASE